MTGKKHLVVYTYRSEDKYTSGTIEYYKPLKRWGKSDWEKITELMDKQFGKNAVPIMLVQSGRV